ncbi:MAG: hypothetical protein WKG07_46330 [Hymenobacter sp.]
MFGPDRAAAALVLPAVPLDEMYAEPARRPGIEARGNECANQLRRHGLVVRATAGEPACDTRDELIEAPVVISTVPWYAFVRRCSTGDRRSSCRPPSHSASAAGRAFADCER